MKVRYCIVCNEEMHVHKNSGKKYCESCIVFRNRKKSLEHYHKQIKNGKRAEYRKRAIPAARRSHLKLRYGITEEQYQELFDKQNGCCPVCLRHQSQLKKRLAVDHIHDKDPRKCVIRGLLCDNCNRRVVGRHKDADFLQRAVDYIRGPHTSFVVPKQKRKRKRASRKKRKTKVSR